MMASCIAIRQFGQTSATRTTTGRPVDQSVMYCAFASALLSGMFAKESSKAPVRVRRFLSGAAGECSPSKTLEDAND